MNVATGIQSVLINKTQIYLMGLMTAVANATLTAVGGGNTGEIVKAFGQGFLIGAGMGLLICGIVAINVLSIVEAGAFVALTALTTGLADLVLLSVLTV